MTIQKFLLTGLLFFFIFSYSQEKDRIIDTIYVFDNQINRVKLFQNVSKILPQDIEKNTTNVSEFLRFQTPIYIKENGRGATSSPSFRGTTAQHTAFVWNGININSAFLGQGDINNISIFGYDAIEIKAGGGSVIYGSSAIGGSIHLNNEHVYNQGFKASLFSEIGSYETYNNFLRTSYSNEKLSAKFLASNSISQNNFETENTDGNPYINRNGQYNNTNFSVSIGYKIAPQHKISWISEFYNGKQHYPIFTEIGNKTKYETSNARSLITWNWNKNNFQNNFRIAYTEENFNYFGSLEKPRTSGGTGKNIIIKNDFDYFFNPKWNVNLISEFQNNKAEGYHSGIDSEQRNLFSVAGLLRYFATEKLIMEAGVRKDFVEDFSSPILYSFNGKWNTSNWYEISINFSRNFRFPSYNDLYWQPGGNMNLEAETSYQTELRNQFKFKELKFSVIPYYMKIKNMIRWLPSSYGYWMAFNTNEVESYGIESSLEYEKKFRENNFKFILGHSYTKSINLENKKQLMYVPFHKFFGNIDYQYDFFKIYVQGIYNGLTYTDSEENKSDALQPYLVLNAGISIKLFKNYKMGFKVNNITDEIYETTDSYPMPKRNYSMNLNINF